jgi:hypothetical protein
VELQEELSHRARYRPNRDAGPRAWIACALRGDRLRQPTDRRPGGRRWLRAGDASVAKKAVSYSLSLSLSLSRPRELAGQRGHARFARNSVAAPLSCSRLSRTLTRFRRPRERVMTVVALGSISVVSRLWRPIPFMEWRARAYARLCRSTRSPVLSTTLNGVFASWRSASTIPISPGRASSFSTSALVFR